MPRLLFVFVFLLAIVVRNSCPSFIGQLNKFAVLGDHEALVVLETVYDHAWLDADDVSLEHLDALALWNLRVVTAASVQVLLNRLHRRALKDNRPVSRPADHRVSTVIWGRRVTAG